MKKLVHRLLMLSSFFFLADCHKKNSSSSSENQTLSKSTASEAASLQTQVQNLTASLQNQHLDFNAEYASLLQALSTYQNSTAYTNPQNDHQKLLNVLVPILSSLSDATAKQSMQNQILAGNFQIFDQAFANMGDYASLIQSFANETGQILASSKDLSTPPTTVPPQAVNNMISALQSLPITVADTEIQTLVSTLAEIQTQSTTGTQTATSVKQNNHELVLVSGIFVFAITGLALYHAGKRGYEIFKADGGTYKKNFAKNLFQDSALFGKSAALIFFSVMIMNGLISGNNINMEYVKDPVLIGGLMSALMTVYWIAELYMNLNGETLDGTKFTEKNKFHTLDIMGAIFGKDGEDGFKRPGMTEDHALEYKGPKMKVFGHTIYEHDGKHSQGIGYAKNIGSIFTGAVLAGASAYAYTQLKLANSNTEAPEQVLIGALMRFYSVCEILSQNKVLVMN